MRINREILLQDFIRARRLEIFLRERNRSDLAELVRLQSGLRDRGEYRSVVDHFNGYVRIPRAHNQIGMRCREQRIPNDEQRGISLPRSTQQFLGLLLHIGAICEKYRFADTLDEFFRIGLRMQRSVAFQVDLAASFRCRNPPERQIAVVPESESYQVEHHCAKRGLNFIYIPSLKPKDMLSDPSIRIFHFRAEKHILEAICFEQEIYLNERDNINR